MRIIRGILGGRIINAPAGLPVRPTTDFAKSGIFNILENRYNLKQCSVLDLYSGIGGISFEFLSREVIELVGVDNHTKCIQFLNNTKSKILPNSSATFIASDALAFLNTTYKKFDIIFADPPFAITPANELVEIIFSKNLLKSKGIFVLEHEKTITFEHLPYFESSRKYGNIIFSIFKPLNN